MKNKKKITYIDKDGYKRFSDTDILVHRHVAEMMLGRRLRDGEVVHHRNRVKTDNRRENLWVFESQNKHHYIHKKDERKTGQW